MNLRLMSALLGCALSLTVAGSAGAQPRLQPPGGGGQQQPAQPVQPGGGGGMLSATTPEITAAAMQAAGYTDVQIITHEGKRHVTGKALNTPIYVLHYSSEGDSAATIKYFVSFGQQSQINLTWMNAWNQEKRFGRMYQAANGNVIFDMDVHFFGGVSPEYMKETAVVFSTILKFLLEFQPGQQQQR